MVVARCAVAAAAAAAAAALGLLTPHAALAAPQGAEVTALPGWDKPLPSRTFSGMLESTKGGQKGYHVHYVLMEAEMDTPEEAPLIVWFNGGPGASSLFGVFVELGPLVLSDESLKTAAYNATGVPTPQYNPHAWTRVGNVLAFSSPPPVGYSYCDAGGVTGGGRSCGPWDDETTAEVNKGALEAFFGAYPEYAKRPTFITGESYAGVYVPTLAEAVMNDPNTAVNLKGFAVGDPCIGTKDQDPAYGVAFQLDFLWGHGQLSKRTAAEVEHACAVDTSPRATAARIAAGEMPANGECTAALKQMKEEVGGYYTYALYDECWGENDLSSSASPAPTSKSEPLPYLVVDEQRGAARVDARLRGGLNDYQCGGPVVYREWLNRTEVKTALNLDPASVFFECDDGTDFDYTSSREQLFPFYRQVAKSSDVRVLVYNGDTDPCLNSFYAANFTASLGFEEKQAWRPWTRDGRSKMGGYVVRYATQGGFDFVTIRGAGHMTPWYKPAATLAMLQAWIAGDDYPRYAPQAQAAAEAAAQ